VRVHFKDTTINYDVIPAYACKGEVMVCRIPHELDGMWVRLFMKQQADFEKSYWERNRPAKGEQPTEAQWEELDRQLRSLQGPLECYMDWKWRGFVQSSSKANNERNHIISVAPTGIASLIDSLAAAKRILQAAGGRCASLYD
jgi:hypothetical protein